MRLRAEMLRAWANYILQKAYEEPITDWVAAHKVFLPKKGQDRREDEEEGENMNFKTQK